MKRRGRILEKNTFFHFFLTNFEISDFDKFWQFLTSILECCGCVYKGKAWKIWSKKSSKKCRYSFCSGTQKISQHHTLPLYLHFKKISQHHFFKFLTFLKKIVKNRSKIKFRSTTLCPCISNFCVRSTTFKIHSGTTLQGYSEKKCEKKWRIPRVD